MSWFVPKTEKPAIPPEKAVWAVCPKCKSHFGKTAFSLAGEV